MGNLEEYTALLRARLSKKRYTHSLNVAQEARVLAQIYGEDEEKAYCAGLLHDICKELSYEEQEEMVLACGFAVSPEELATKQVWHGIAGAFYMRVTLGIKDPDILNAVRFHTVGRAGMSRLEELIYLADLVSADRTYEDVEEMRRLAHTDCNAAMLYALRFSIDTTLRKGGYLPHYTSDAYNQYVYCSKQEKNRKKNKHQ